jgi:hypothetical protein
MPRLSRRCECTSVTNLRLYEVGCVEDGLLSIRPHSRDQCKCFFSSSTFSNTRVSFDLIATAVKPTTKKLRIRSHSTSSSQTLSTNNTQCLPTNLNREAGASATLRLVLWSGASSNTSPAYQPTPSSSPSLASACLLTSTRVIVGGNGRSQHWLQSAAPSR